jgi:MORN repeat
VLCVTSNRRGLRHGTGARRLANGSVYEGSWADGRPHGEGVIRCGKLHLHYTLLITVLACTAVARTAVLYLRRHHCYSTLQCCAPVLAASLSRRCFNCVVGVSLGAYRRL